MHRRLGAWRGVRGVPAGRLSISASPSRFLAGLGGGKGAPKHVAVFELGPGTSAVAAIDALLGKASKLADPDPTCEWGRPVTAYFATEKQAMTFTACSRGAHGDVARAVAVARMADVVMLLMNPVGGAAGDVDASVDCAGKEFLTALKAAGTPAIVGGTQGLLALTNRKKQAEARKWATAVFEDQFPGKTTKTADCDNAVAVLRALATVRPKPVAWLTHRPYMLATALQFTPTGRVPTPAPAAPTSDPEALVAAAVSPLGLPDPDAVAAFGRAYSSMPAEMEVGTLEISGYLRGCPLHVDGLVHISGVGTYPVQSVTAPRGLLEGGAGSSAGSPVVVATADPSEVEDQHTLGEEDMTAGEQTWPTAEEEAAAAAEARLKALTKATGSKTQAVWLDAIGEGDEELAAAGGVEALLAQDDEGSEGEDEDATSVAETAAPSKAELRAAAAAAEREHLEFPDEVDTPGDVPARQRFARYRGMRSFRTSPWDPQESLPRSYARIFQLGNFAASQRAILKDSSVAEATVAKVERHLQEQERAAKRAGGADAAAPGAGGQSALEVAQQLTQHAGEGWVPQGRYVCLTITGVPAAVVLQRLKPEPLTVLGLLPHEHRTSIMHFNVKRISPEVPAGEDGDGEAAAVAAGLPADFVAVNGVRCAPIKSKTDLEFVIGTRRIMTRAVFSENALNCDKAKFEKYLHADRWTQATAFAPITFGAVPVLVYAAGRDGTRVLVAAGTAASCEPDRIILKKIILSGYPLKCKRRGAMVKYMFHNPEDIRYFKPVELWTKHGLAGRIREPVGTHGSMKCHFSGSVYSHDTVCMSLFKRVYPRWGASYRHLVGDAAMEASVGSTIAGPLGTTTGAAPNPLDAFMAAQEQESDARLA